MHKNTRKGEGPQERSPLTVTSRTTALHITQPSTSHQHTHTTPSLQWNTTQNTTKHKSDAAYPKNYPRYLKLSLQSEIKGQGETARLTPAGLPHYTRCWGSLRCLECCMEAAWGRCTHWLSNGEPSGEQQIPPHAWPCSY